MGLWGRLETMREPIIGEAKKGTPINKSVRVNLVLTLLGTCGADEDVQCDDGQEHRHTHHG